MQNVKIISAKGFWDKTQRLEIIQNVISKTTLKIKSLADAKRAMWSQCWAIWGPCPVLGHLDHLSWKRPYWDFSCSHVGELRGLVGPMLGKGCLCWALCWAICSLCGADGGSFGGLYGLPWRFLEGKNNPQRESLCVEGYFGSLFETMSGQCWAVLGLCWAHVGSFDGLFGVPWSLSCWGFFGVVFCPHNMGTT